MPYLEQATFKREWSGSWAWGGALVGTCLPPRREQRVAGEMVLQVGEHQLLVLLFMVEAQLDQCGQLGWKVCGGEGLLHMLIDMPAIGQHLLQRRSGQHPAFGAGVAIAYAEIVGIEEYLEGGIEGRRWIGQLTENEGFEKPAGMRQVPLERAGFGHGLQLAVFRAQPVNQLDTVITHVAIARLQSCSL